MFDLTSNDEEPGMTDDAPVLSAEFDTDTARANDVLCEGAALAERLVSRTLNDLADIRVHAFEDRIERAW